MNASDVTAFRSDLDIDDGLRIYELEFWVDNCEYDYEINADTGEILSSEKEYHGSPASSPSSQSSTPNPTSLITSKKAQIIAFDHADVNPNDVIGLKCKLDVDNGIEEYEIEFKCDGYEYDIDINAKTGTVTKYDKERDDDIQRTAPKQSTPSNKKDNGAKDPAPKENTSSGTTTDLISKSKAKSIALKRAGVSNVSGYKCELDIDDGIKVYEIEFRSGGYEYDIDINAKTGKVVKFDKELDD